MELWGLGVVSTGSASGMVRGLRQPSKRGDMRRHGGADSMPALHDTVGCEPYGVGYTKSGSMPARATSACMASSVGASCPG